MSPSHPSVAAPGAPSLAQAQVSVSLGSATPLAQWTADVVVLSDELPRIADAIIVSVSVMWTYITVAEYVNAKVGLGQLIQNARRFSAMDQVFAGIIVIMALALLTYQLMRMAKRRLYPWETQT